MLSGASATATLISYYHPSGVKSVPNGSLTNIQSHYEDMYAPNRNFNEAKIDDGNAQTMLSQVQFEQLDFANAPQDQPQISWETTRQFGSNMTNPYYPPRGHEYNSIKLVFEILGTVLAACAFICLFLMMLLLVASNQPDSFVPAALAVLATSVITSCVWYWTTRKSRSNRY